MTTFRPLALGLAFVVSLTTAATLAAQPFASADLQQLRSVGDVQLSPDGTRIAYSVQSNDRPGAPYTQIWIRDLNGGATRRLGTDRERARGPRWSPDGRHLAFWGRDGDHESVMIATADGGSMFSVALATGTNHPLPSSGESLAWSPDSRQVAFVSGTPGPETDANGDPMVISRYLYKPTASEGLTRFNDNRRLHIFIARTDTKEVRQLTEGDYYEHSIDWSPDGNEIVFVSNRGIDPDRFFNYDIFTVNVNDRKIRRLTDTRHAEYRPTWSPDGRTIAYLGTTRPLTSSETTMEDTHVWLIGADGRDRRELGGQLDNRQSAPAWSHDGAAVLATVQERGSTGLLRLAVRGGAPGAGFWERGALSARGR
jgi:Tol biopolymer transport system component